MKEIIENNTLLAEFLGSEIEETVEGEKVYCLLIPDEKDISGLKKEFFAPDELNFHKSWDWLMLIVEKMANIEGFNDIQNDLKDLKNTAAINIVYNACIEFVKWFNSQNK